MHAGCFRHFDDAGQTEAIQGGQDDVFVHAPQPVAGKPRRKRQSVSEFMVMNQRLAAGRPTHPGKPREAMARLRGLKVAKTQCGLRPAVKPQRGRAFFRSGVKQHLICGHVVRAVSKRERKPTKETHTICSSSKRIYWRVLPATRQRRIGSLAALISSGRLMPNVCGASCKKSASSSRIFIMASANPSSVSLLSVSVGSIIIASGTTSGKYTVGE